MFFQKIDPVTGQKSAMFSVRCTECGRYYLPRTLIEDQARRCPGALHAVDRLRAMGVWKDE